MGFVYFYLGVIAWELFGFGIISLGLLIVLVVWLFTRAAKDDEQKGDGNNGRKRE
jgi:uncharacterized membrane protein YqjE